MENPINSYWKARLSIVRKNLESNNFDVFMAENLDEAKTIILEKIIPDNSAKSVSWGGSMTLSGTGLVEEFRRNRQLDTFDPFDKTLLPEEAAQARRSGMTADLFFTGTNALTESGQLVNLDMTGNRVGAIAYGPKHVVVLLGRNKIVADIEKAIHRIKNFAAPANAMRLKKKTPCVQTSRCEECKSPDRICNTWTITEKSFPKGRIKVILINESLGL